MKKQILMIYPKLGMAGTLTVHMPLSLLYASVNSIKSGFKIDILDLRIEKKDWKESITNSISKDTIIIGISVMTGAPIKNALEITRWIKNKFPNLTTIWGGPHCTFNGKEVLEEPTVDYAIAGYGSKPLSKLASFLSGNNNKIDKFTIEGLIYREKDKIITIPPENKFEFIEYDDIPYHLIESNLNKYGQLDSKENIFPIYSAMGCPYNCAFCSSPAQYKNIKKKFQPIDKNDVVDHIEFVQKKYGATYIYFIDDDSFPSLSRVEEIIDEIEKRELKLKLGFRGARINEIKKMNDSFLTKLVRVGTDIMHIGAESGSQKILDLIKKDCTVEDIIDINKKLSRHPEILTAYNWIVGLPGENLEDLKKTRLLMLRLVKDNPNAIIFMPNKFRPLPGTELYILSIENGYTEPLNLEEWIEMEAEGDYRPPWYTKKIVKMINMMQITSFFIDNKIYKVKTGNTFKFNLLKIVSILYYPFAYLRLKYGITFFLIEYKLFYLYSSFYR